MILRLESIFLQTTNKLGNPFSEENKENLARLVENNFNKIRNAITLQEQSKEEYKPAFIELGKIGKSIFSLSIYYRRDDMGDDIPMSIRELLPTQSPTSRSNIQISWQKRIYGCNASICCYSSSFCCSIYN